MSQSLASDSNDPHQSPIWIKAEHVLCIAAPGTDVPHTIFGSRPCPITLTESVVQLSLPSPYLAHSLGETQKTMVDQDVQSEWMVLPVPILVHPGRPNLTWKHYLSLIRRLMLEHHPAGPCQFSRNRPNRDNAVGPGPFTFIKTLRQWLKAYRKMCRLGKGP